MSNRITVLELEKESLAQKVEGMEMKAEKVNERVQGNYESPSVPIVPP